MERLRLPDESVVEFMRFENIDEDPEPKDIRVTYSAWGKQKEAEAAVAALLEKRPDFSVDDAVEFYRKYQFPQSYLDKMSEDLRRAGLKDRGS